jgi:hypothetical protein
MFLTMFEPYTDLTYILIIASEKGKGKSVRASRLSEVMVPGWCGFNSGNSAKAGMNGEFTLTCPTNRPTKLTDTD